ncbi:MAG TPA: YhjD/YihY/BrkB family envelope integrity protein [Edaphobacter sp.]|nr:YhjD/YihY/BrkB family envelope integrity protein [Edaphobacter sp.]
MVSLVISSALATASKYFEALVHVPLALLSVLNFLISLGGIAVLFALIFKFVPETDVHWRDVRLGAFLTAVLFTVGKALIGLYIGRTGVGSPFSLRSSRVTRSDDRLGVLLSTDLSLRCRVHTRLLHIVRH